MIKLLFNRLIARGWDSTFLKAEILKVVNNNPNRHQDTLLDTIPRCTDPDRTAFLHIQYHPNDLPRQTIRAIYENTCGEIFKKEIGVENCLIAYSRPTNLRNLLTPTTLHQAPGKEVSTYLGETR